MVRSVLGGACETCVLVSDCLATTRVFVMALYSNVALSYTETELQNTVYS